MVTHLVDVVALAVGGGPLRLRTRQLGVCIRSVQPRSRQPLLCSSCIPGSLQMQRENITMM